LVVRFGIEGLELPLLEAASPQVSPFPSPK